LGIVYLPSWPIQERAEGEGQTEAETRNEQVTTRRAKAEVKLVNGRLAGT